MRSSAIFKPWPSRANASVTASKVLAPDVPWRAIAGFRNVIVHDYLGVDLGMVWQVLVADLPNLRDGLLRLKAASGQTQTRGAPGT